jgi:hypothetical protein
VAQLILFSYQIDVAADPDDRAAIESQIEAEMHLPGRQRRVMLAASYLVRFTQQDMDLFVASMDDLADSFSVFRYTAAGWDPAASAVETFP